MLSIDRHEMVFTGAGQRDITHGDHFINLHFVFNDGDFGKIGVVQTGEYFINVHFGDTRRCFSQTVIAQVKAQQIHNFRHMLGNTLLTRISI